MYFYEEDRETRSERVKKNEEEILKIIKDYYTKHKYSPTVREIAKKANVSSTSTVLRYLNKLQAQGMIDWQSKAPRTIRVIE